VGVRSGDVTKLIVPTSRNTVVSGGGVYRVNAVVSRPATPAGGVREILSRKNRATVIARNALPYPTAGSAAVQTPVTYVDFDAADGDYYEFLVYQDSGGGIGLTLTDPTCCFFEGLSGVGVLWISSERLPL
jgi:hypothetical protein